jgi:hypothetical protein
MKPTRKTCLPCVLKHLGQSIILFAEAGKGYPHHKYLALGHMAEAEDESITNHPELCSKIRDVRLKLEAGGNPSYSVEDLIKIVAQVNEKEGGDCNC